MTAWIILAVRMRGMPSKHLRSNHVDIADADVDVDADNSVGLARTIEPPQMMMMTTMMMTTMLISSNCHYYHGDGCRTGTRRKRKMIWMLSTTS